MALTINDPGNAEDWPSRSGRRTAKCRTCTASRTSRRRDRPATGGSSRTSSRRARRSSRARPASCEDRRRRRTQAAKVGGCDYTRGQRHEHGGAARLRRHRGLPVGAPGVHRPAGAGEGDLPRHGDRPRPRPRTSRARASSISCARSSRSEANRGVMATIAGFPPCRGRVRQEGELLDATRPSGRSRKLHQGRRSPICWSSRTAGTTTWPKRRAVRRVARQRRQVLKRASAAPRTGSSACWRFLAVARSSPTRTSSRVARRSLGSADTAAARGRCWTTQGDVRRSGCRRKAAKRPRGSSRISNTIQQRAGSSPISSAPWSRRADGRRGDESDKFFSSTATS